MQLDPGKVVGRYGDAEGNFFSDPGKTANELGLPPGAAVPGRYQEYVVLKPFITEAGPAGPVPAFGASGGAMQYMGNGNVQWLIDNGFLAKYP
jgi:hypothetical protein